MTGFASDHSRIDRRSALLQAGAWSALPLLAACGGRKPPPPPPPTVVRLDLQATPEVNPDDSGAAKPVRVRVLRLANTQALSEADFFALDANPGAVLGQDLVGLDDFVLAPGSSLPYEREFEPTARYVAVMGAYYDIATAQWRAWAPVEPNATNSFTALFDRHGVALAGATA
jgi:type VI secretion system protein VasD